MHTKSIRSDWNLLFKTRKYYSNVAIKTYNFKIYTYKYYCRKFIAALSTK